MNRSKILFSVSLIFFVACNNATQTVADKAVDSASTTAVQLPSRTAFQTTMNGKPVDLYILKNKNNLQAAITNYGGRVISLLVPDKNGNMTDMIVGYKTIRGFENSSESYFGAIVGRYGNRIARGKFTLDGKQYPLFINNGANTLHGGKKGYESAVWNAKQLNDSTLELTYLSKDMEEGFPGNLDVKVTYSLTGDNGLKCAYEAKTDKKTVVNLTNHSYFNLNGIGSGNILNHIVQINANRYTPTDTGLIPTGKLEPVAGTPFDFTKPETIGARIETDNVQLKNGHGYDQNFVLNKTDTTRFSHAATVTGDKSGIVMDIYTEEPGLQFYTGNFMQGKNTLNGASKDDFRTAFAMETQHFPDSPNEPSFPSTVLEPGKLYKTSSVYMFSVKK